MARRRRKNLHISVNCDRKSSPKWSITTVFPIMTSHRILKNFRLRRATLKNVKKCVLGRLRRPKKLTKNRVFLKNVEFPPPWFSLFSNKGGGKNSTFLRWPAAGGKFWKISINYDRKSSPKWPITMVFPIITSHMIQKISACGGLHFDYSTKY